MQINFSAITVENPDHALHFYTKILSFVKYTEIPIGEFKWLTVTSRDGIEGVELVLAPLGFPPARVYQKTLYDAGIPAAA